MNVFWCEATLKPLDRQFILNSTADAAPDPIEGPATTNLAREEYFFFEEEAIEVVCQSRDTPTAEMSITHHEGMELKEPNDTLHVASDVSNGDIQPKVQETANEVQVMPSFLMDLHIKSVQKFRSLYSVGNLLGTGGFGSVYEGVCKSDGQPVAIKFIPNKDSQLRINLPGETCKLPIEVALMKIVSKPPFCMNVLQLLDWFEISNYLLLVLERPVPCMDVFSLYEREDVHNELLAKIIMLQVVEAATHCYNRGVFHSDIKMENLLINLDTMDVKLIDFGCGRLWQETPYKDYAGTIDFLPPECILQKQYYAYPATVWSLGILLFNLVCGTMPFRNTTEIVCGPLHFGSGLSKDCRQLIQWCLKKDPSKRPSFGQISEHCWFKSDLCPTDMKLPVEMGGPMCGTSQQLKVGVLQSSDMETQRLKNDFPESMDSQQILMTLKKHIGLQ